jgi:hypothetical protein
MFTVYNNISQQYSYTINCENNMAQFLAFLDQNSIINYVALDDISCIIAYEHDVDGTCCKTAIYTKSDPGSYLSSLLTPGTVMSGNIINIRKLL